MLKKYIYLIILSIFFVFIFNVNCYSQDEKLLRNFNVWNVVKLKKSILIETLISPTTVFRIYLFNNGYPVPGLQIEDPNNVFSAGQKYISVKFNNNNYPVLLVLEPTPGYLIAHMRNLPLDFFNLMQNNRSFFINIDGLQIPVNLEGFKQAWKYATKLVNVKL